MAAGFKTATVNASDVPATQSNFPVYVDLSRLGITTQAEADSVRVYADSGKTTEWAREIVSVSEMWVKVPSLTSTTAIYVDWDGTSSDYAAGDTYGRNAVWTGYSFVWHGNYSSPIESSGNQSLTAVSVTNGTGHIGSGTDFSGSNQYLYTGNFTASFPYSVQCWAKPDSSTTTGMYGAKYLGGANIQLQFFQAGSAVRARAHGSSGGYVGRQITSATATSYNLFHATFESTVSAASHVHVFKNGVESDNADDNGGTLGTANQPNQALYLGVQEASLSADYAGQLDEFRVATSQLTENWTTTEYNNQSDEAGFWGTWSDVGGGGSTPVSPSRHIWW